MYMYNSSQTWYMQNFNILTSLCSWVDWLELYMVRKPEDMFSRIEAQIWIYTTWFWFQDSLVAIVNKK